MHMCGGHSTIRGQLNESEHSKCVTHLIKQGVVERLTFFDSYGVGAKHKCTHNNEIHMLVKSFIIDYDYAKIRMHFRKYDRAFQRLTVGK